MNTFGKHSGVWDFPKGGVEAKDISLEAAVIRELAEETGTDQYVVKQQLPEQITFSFSDETRKRIGYERQETTMFLVEFIGNANDLKPLDSEIDEIKLVESNELLNHLTHEETALYIREHVGIPFRLKL
ncbi:NUDIX hydrolase [Paenibacillus sp. RC67]|uniref:NUDIX domain-containing protein n=1 Tax=Paenibacillus sp. RC67 TaxID=3039392 RepID=UPI0024AE25B2|nr:NUDIX hydrolase [Paenibacillus sp. RC67]